MQQNWTEKKERGSVLLLKLIVWIARVTGRRPARALLLPISLYFLLAAGDSRRASRQYLARVLMRKPGWGDLFRHFHSFAGVLLDRLFFLLGRADLFELRVIEDDYVTLDAATRARGVFLMGAHLGSFEALRLASRRQDALQLVLLMYAENAKKISTMLAAINPRAQQEIVALGKLGTMLTVRERLQQGALVGILADRTLADEQSIQTLFLGHPASFPIGPFKLAALLRRPVFLMVGLYQGHNRYHIHIEKIADFAQPEASIQAAMQHYVARLEYFCRLSPYNWFNFYDFWQGQPA